MLAKRAPLACYKWALAGLGWARCSGALFLFGLSILLTKVRKNTQMQIDPQIIQKAKSGDAEAQNQLGVACLSGIGLPKNYKEAFKWWTKAAEQGNARAQHSLGVIYADGLGVTRDNKKAITWFKKAAVQGYAPAQTNVGSMYFKGQGVVKDVKESAKWYIKAANQNYPAAQLFLSVMYSQGLGVVKDLTKTYQWLWLAEKNDPTIKPDIGLLRKKMTTSQITEAENKIKDFLEKK